MDTAYREAHWRDFAKTFQHLLIRPGRRRARPRRPVEQRLEPDDLRIQWRTFNDELEDLIRKQPAASSLDFMKLLLHPSKKLYRGVEGVLSILVRAAVARGGLESVCETMVSVMEAHTPSLRGILDQRRLEDEILVAWNGEDVFHCDQVQ